MLQNGNARSSRVKSAIDTSSRSTGAVGSEHQRAGRAQLLAALAMVGLAIWTGALAALHLVRPDVNDTSTISAYAVGPYGWLMTAAFLALGLSALALALGIRRATVPSRWSLAGSLLIGLFGVGFFLAGIFPVGGCRDVQCVERFEAGTDVSMSAPAIIHGVGSLLGILLLIVGMLVLARAFKRDQRWRPLRLWSLVLGLAALVQFFVSGEGLVGAVLMRTLVVTLILWMLLAALRLRSVAREPVA